jgi:hypothetical protein
LKNEQIVQVFQQLIVNHVVPSGVLGVVDFHVVERLICHILFLRIVVELLDQYFGRKLRLFKRKKI